jgi:hypothetical protein
MGGQSTVRWLPGVEVVLHSFASSHGETGRRDKDGRPWH